VVDLVAILSEEAGIRSKSLLGLVKKPHALPPPYIGYVVKHDPSDEVACIAAFLLRFQGKRKALTTVIKLLQSDLNAERMYCTLNSVRYWREPSIVTPLIKLSDSSAYPVRLLALLLLAKHEDKRDYVIARLENFREVVGTSPPITPVAPAFCPAPVFRSIDEAIRLAETTLDQLRRTGQ